MMYYCIEVDGVPIVVSDYDLEQHPEWEQLLC